MRGNLGSYINNENLADNTPLGQNVIGHIVTSIQPFMPEEYAEGRLFDQAREWLHTALSAGFHRALYLGFDNSQRGWGKSPPPLSDIHCTVL